MTSKNIEVEIKTFLLLGGGSQIQKDELSEVYHFSKCLLFGEDGPVKGWTVCGQICGNPPPVTQKTTPRPCGFLQQGGMDRSAPTTKTGGETVQRWKTLMTPCHASSQQLCITECCPGPNQRGLDMHCHHMPTIQISLLTCTHKELLDIEIWDSNIFCYYMFISSLQRQDFLKERNGGKIDTEAKKH